MQDKPVSGITGSSWGKYQDISQTVKTLLLIIQKAVLVGSNLCYIDILIDWNRNFGQRAGEP